MESADIVLMHSDLMDVPAAIALSRRTIKTIKENLFWAFGYNVLGIPVAAGLCTCLAARCSPHDCRRRDELQLRLGAAQRAAAETLFIQTTKGGNQ